MEEALNLTCVSASDIQISDVQPCFRRGIRALDDLEILGLLLSRHHYHLFSSSYTGAFIPNAQLWYMSRKGASNCRRPVVGLRNLAPQILLRRMRESLTGAGLKANSASNALEIPSVYMR